MRKGNGNQQDNPADPSDLQQIKGIGQSTAQALNELGIHRIADLAQYTNQELVIRLTNHLPPLTLKRIEREDWVGQARLLVQANRTPGHSTSASQPAGWQEVADFFLSLGYITDASGEKHLQTKAYHSQTDQGHQWDGLAMPEAMQWILAQSGLTPAETPERPPEIEAQQPGSNENTTEVELELVDLWIAEVAEEKASQLRATCTLVLNGPKAEVETYEQSPYQVETYLVNRTTNQSQLAVTCLGTLAAGQLAYPIQQDFKIPAVGSYQIYVMARLQTPGEPATHVQGPVLQVEP